MDNVFGALGYFFKLNENSRGSWISKYFIHSFIKRFQKKTLEGILGQTPPPPTKSLPYTYVDINPPPLPL